jgi:hypothetical protein
MSADVHDLTGDKTMNANLYVRLANDNVWLVRSTGGTSNLIADAGASKTAYRRPHAPRSDKPEKAPLPGLHFLISSISELRNSTTRPLRVSECAPPSLRLLDPLRTRYRRRIGDSPTDHINQIHSPILRPKLRNLRCKLPCVTFLLQYRRYATILCHLSYFRIPMARPVVLNEQFSSKARRFGGIVSFTSSASHCSRLSSQILMWEAESEPR